MACEKLQTHTRVRTHTHAYPHTEVGKEEENLLQENYRVYILFGLI